VNLIEEVEFYQFNKTKGLICDIMGGSLLKLYVRGVFGEPCGDLITKEIVLSFADALDFCWTTLVSLYS